MTMYTMKTIVTAVSLAVLTTAGAASVNAAPFHHRSPARQEFAFHHAPRPVIRPVVMRERIFDTLRFNHYRAIGTPVFVRGHYVVKSFNRRGHTVFVEVNPYSGAIVGEFRI